LFTLTNVTAFRAALALTMVLARMTSEDARVLTEIRARNKHTEAMELGVGQEGEPRSPWTHKMSPTYGEGREAFKHGQSVNHGVLESLNPIGSEGYIWRVTLLGKAFLEAVSEPKRRDDGPAPAASE
jgi:hypothetical protein